MEEVFFKVKENLKELNGEDISLPFCVFNHCKKYADKKRFLESVSAWILLDEILEKSFGKSLFDYKISFSKNGKPELDGIFVSISHTEKFSAVCVSKIKVGIDIEEMKPRQNYLKIAKKISTEKTDNLEQFYQLWTKKEATVKLFDLKFFEKKNIKKTNIYSKSFQIQKNYVTIVSEKDFNLMEI